MNILWEDPAIELLLNGVAVSALCWFALKNPWVMANYANPGSVNESFLSAYYRCARFLMKLWRSTQE